ncbi:MAG: hypothetical protein ACPLRP_00725 [Candidatus Bipolaricaulaceae bacterium]
MAGAHKIITVEGNTWGQLGKLLAQETGLKPAQHIARYDGRPFTPEGLLSALAHEA